jgi:hypothetical protein
VTEVGT